MDIVALLSAHVPPPAHDVPPIHEEYVNNGEGENSSMNDNEGVQDEEVKQRQESQQSQQPQSSQGQIQKIHIKPIAIRLRCLLMAIFTWEREDEAEVRKKFNSRATKWLKDALESARKKKKQSGWIVDDIRHKLWQKWNIEEYQKLCKKNQQNRKSDNNGSMTTYHNGSASFEDHKKKMEIEAGQPVLVFEVFKKMFQREDGSWKEDHAHIAYLISFERLANADEGKEINYDVLWWEIGEHKGGSCFRFGNLVEDFQSSIPNLASSSVSEVSDPKIHKVVGDLEVDKQSSIIEEQNKFIEEQRLINKCLMTFIVNSSGTLPSLPAELARTMESASHVPRALEDVDQPTANELPVEQQ
ncbi:Transposase, Ptta/En/Spm, plant [Corchorus olitorius]|uniref:Transposase, Ptta/En/Spm, plant n=1 Tax=Corchorus olitorius TaxID=93759 RepID=A0A1R3I7Q2_9ROSI|nr:Transposase, Ptta/En/Spm, plant [Corchorus olitorius]